MIDDNEQQISIVESSPSIGEQLRQAREAKNLTIAEVAALIKLAKDTLANMEADNWEALHGRIYARGYLISYVKFLGLPEDAILAAFDIEYKPTEVEKAGPQQFNNTKFPWLPVVMIVIVLVITWFAYQQWQLSETEATDDSAAVSQLKGNERSNKQNTIDTLSLSVVEPIIGSGEEA